MSKFLIDEFSILYDVRQIISESELAWKLKVVGIEFRLNQKYKFDVTIVTVKLFLKTEGKSRWNAIY